MKSVMTRSICNIALMAAALSVSAQTGGIYQLEKSVVSPAGGASSGGGFSIQFTVGQPIAGGPLQGSDLSAYIGFWIPELAPTAAHVSLSGRVRTGSGQGVPNVVVTLTSQDGEVWFARTGTFGNYTFVDVRAGETYFLSVHSNRFRFESPIRVISVLDEAVVIDFIAIEP